MLSTLVDIDTRISEALLPLRNIAALVDMPLVCELADEVEIARHNYSGLYRIDVQTPGASADLHEWVNALRCEWEHEDFKNCSTPSLKKKRISRHTSLLEWMPLYLGKSKNVANRVLEHINLPLVKTTFALKLKSRPAMAMRAFRLHTLRVQVENYDVVVPVLERALRDRFHPLIGKQ
jgi:hypothetical protein